MTALKRDATWSSVHGLDRSTGGGCFGADAGVGAPVVVGVSTSIASSSRAGVAVAEGVATLLRPAFFFGAMSCCT